MDVHEQADDPRSSLAIFHPIYQLVTMNFQIVRAQAAVLAEVGKKWGHLAAKNGDTMNPVTFLDLPLITARSEWGVEIASAIQLGRQPLEVIVVAVCSCMEWSVDGCLLPRINGSCSFAKTEQLELSRITWRRNFQTTRLPSLWPQVLTANLRLDWFGLGSHCLQQSRNVSLNSSLASFMLKLNDQPQLLLSLDLSLRAVS